MLNISISQDAQIAYPDLRIGVLLITNVDNRFLNDNLRFPCSQLQDQLFNLYGSYSRKELSEIATLMEYSKYYKKFGKTYHVLLQLESIAHKQKSIPEISPLIQAMFMAEIENMILTAGHDYDTIQGPIVIDVAQGNEEYQLMSGDLKQIQKNDLYIRANDNIISSIIYGPDRNTKISDKTRNALYTSYVPFEMGEAIIKSHLAKIAGYINNTQANAKVEYLNVIT